MVGGGMDWEFRTDICTLRYMELLHSGDLLYSMENSTQYSIIIYLGKESEREWMREHVKLNHFFVQQKLSQHCESTIFHLNFTKRKRLH